MSHGIYVAEPGGTVQKDPQFSSDRKGLLVDIIKQPYHLDVIENLTATQAFVDSSPDISTQREVVFELEHGYGFKPYTLTFFYLFKVDFDESGAIYPLTGSYGNDFFLYGAGAADDYLTTEVDEKFFRIVHKLDSYGAQSGGVSDAAQYHFRTKYYITSSPLGS